MRTCLTAERRSEGNRSALRALRSKGRLPGVLYGRNVEAMKIHVSTGDVRKQLQTGRTELIDLQVEDKKYPVLIKEIHRHPFTGELLHVDFHQITMDQPVRMKVPVELVGTAPGTKVGGLLQVQATFVEVEGLPGQIPPVIEADIGKLELGDKLTAGDLVVPDGVTLISSADELLASVVAPRGVRESAGAEAAEETEEKTEEAG